MLEQLDESSLVLNVLRPLLAQDEDEVRSNVVKWVQNVRQMRRIDPEVEEQLLIVMSQFIEQKFSTLTYKELGRMLHLTPFEETTSARELLTDERLEILSTQIEMKFSPSGEKFEEIMRNLQFLELPYLKDLIKNLIAIETVEDLEIWIADKKQEEQN